MRKIKFCSTGLMAEKNGFGCLPIQRISGEAVKLLRRTEGSQIKAYGKEHGLAKTPLVNITVKLMPKRFHNRRGNAAGAPLFIGLLPVPAPSAQGPWNAPRQEPGQDALHLLQHLWTLLVIFLLTLIGKLSAVPAVAAVIAAALLFCALMIGYYKLLLLL